MRLNAYLPDQLWTGATAICPGCGPSQIVQRALHHMVERSRPRFATHLDSHRQQLLGMRQSRVVQMAQHAYDQGYEGGLQLCETLSWLALERMAAAHWSAAAMAAGGASTTPKLAVSAYHSGMRDALRDVWLSSLYSGGNSLDYADASRSSGSSRRALPS